jgi:hypothetical protein
MDVWSAYMARATEEIDPRLPQALNDFRSCTEVLRDHL